jgi:hypothetical protein
VNEFGRGEILNRTGQRKPGTPKYSGDEHQKK